MGRSPYFLNSRLKKSRFNSRGVSGESRGKPSAQTVQGPTTRSVEEARDLWGPKILPRESANPKASVRDHGRVFLRIGN